MIRRPLYTRLALLSLVPALLLAAVLAGASPAGAQTPALPLPAGDRALAPPDALLDLGTVPPEAVSRDEPPLVARPDATRFVYGESVPRILCLPYRACTLLLHPDETILHLALGDTERWLVEDVSAGGRPTLIFKPTSYNLLTNLVVRTDRRLYVVELLSPAPPAPLAGENRGAEASYDALSEFRYPREWSREVAAAPPAEPASGTDGGATGPSDLHFEYRFKRPLRRARRLAWTPEVVYDDGERTYIRLPDEARRHDLPVVVVLDGSGRPAPADASVDGVWMVVPVVAEELRLVSGRREGTRQLTILRSSGRAEG